MSRVRLVTGATGAGAAVAIPVAIYPLCLCILHYRPSTAAFASLGPAAAIAIPLTPFTGQAIPLIGIILAGLLVTKLVVRHRESISA